MKKTLEQELRENYCKIKITRKEDRANPKTGAMETFIVTEFYHPFDKRVGTTEFKVRLQKGEELLFPLNEVILIDGAIKMIDFKPNLFINNLSKHYKVIEVNEKLHK